MGTASPARKAATAFLVLLILLGLGYYAFAHRTDIERFLRGIPDNGWALAATEADALHGRGLDGSGVVLCVVDSGVDLTHPELQGLELTAWVDLVNNRPVPYDDHGHGTSMVGLIAARNLLTGFAPAVSLVVVKAVDDSGEGQGDVVAQGIEFCLDPGTGTPSHVISLSLGGTPRPRQEDVVATKVAEATAQDVLVVASVGNRGNDARDVQSPATVPSSIGVGAVDQDLRIAPFSQPGDNEERSDPHRKPEVVAPGVHLATAGEGGTYVRVSGTSASAALVAALLALVLQGLGSSPGVTVLKEALMATARPLAGQEEPHDPLYGYGLIQAQALLEALEAGG